MNIHEERVRVARMTSACKEIQYDWCAEESMRFTAILWSHGDGEYISGHGPDEWTAVQSAHAIVEMARGRHTW